MKVICRYSGIEFKAQGFGILKTTSQHPFLDTPLIDVVSKVFPLYLEGKLTEPETRLLFVSLLKNSDLVTFNYHAAPSLRTIHTNMQALLRTLDWSLSKQTVFSLPRFVINRENCTIRNVNEWISAWWEARSNWIDRQTNSYERTAFIIRQESLEKLIKSAYKKVEDFAGKLGRWAMEASSAHPDRHEEWIELFKLREPAVFKADKDEIADLLDWLESHLDATTSDIAQTALKHIRRIAYKNSAGILYGLDEFEEETQQLVLQRDQGTPFVMLSRHERMLRASIVDAPLEEPLPANFPTRLAFLVAKAKWNVSKQLEEKLASASAQEAEPVAIYSPVGVRDMEARNLLDPAFDGEDGTDEAEGTYEEVAEDIVLEALNKMNDSAAADSTTKPIMKAKNLLEEI